MRRSRNMGTVGALLTHHQRAQPGGIAVTALTGIGALLVGGWLGLDLRGSPEDLAGALFSLVLATAAPLPLVAVGCLYHDRLHAAILPWPVSATQHLLIGLRLFASGQWPWIVLLGATCASAALPLGPRPFLLCLAYTLSGFIGAALFSLGLAGLCALLSDADGPQLEQLRAGLAGPFASQRHAPFFYLPALAFGLASLSAGLSQEVALLPLLTHPTPGDGSLAMAVPWFVAPLLGGLVALAAGSWSYAKHALRVIPRVHEEARMVFGGKPAPADPPYGLLLARLLPRRAVPYFEKELREQGRAQRGLWAVLALALLFALLYGVGTGSAARTAPVLALLLLVWTATLPTRRTRRELAGALLLTLPHAAAASWLGRWVALAFVGVHLTAAAAVALAARGQQREALVLGLALLASSAAAISATQPRRRLPLTLIPALALALGLVALAWYPIGLAGLLVLSAAALYLGFRP